MKKKEVEDLSKPWCCVCVLSVRERFFCVGALFKKKRKKVVAAGIFVCKQGSNGDGGT